MDPHRRRKVCPARKVRAAHFSRAGKAPANCLRKCRLLPVLDVERNGQPGVPYPDEEGKYLGPTRDRLGRVVPCCVPRFEEYRGEHVKSNRKFLLLASVACAYVYCANRPLAP